MQYGITSKDQIIDKSTILSGCAALRRAAEDFEMSGNTVTSAGNQCTVDVISVDDQSMEGIFAELAKSIKDVKKVICDAADNIEKLVSQIYDNQTAEYNAYKKKQAEQKNNSK